MNFVKSFFKKLTVNMAVLKCESLTISLSFQLFINHILMLMM